jgi:hypothetical protein
MDHQEDTYSSILVYDAPRLKKFFLQKTKTNDNEFNQKQVTLIFALILAHTNKTN